MGHDYNMSFTTDDGAYQGSYAIQDHVIYERIEELRKWNPSVFEGTWYEPRVVGQYKAIKVRVHQDTVTVLTTYLFMDRENRWVDDVIAGIYESLEKGLNLFLI